jgi:hypothetical protein
MKIIILIMLVAGSVMAADHKQPKQPTTCEKVCAKNSQYGKLCEKLKCPKPSPSPSKSEKKKKS